MTKQNSLQNFFLYYEHQESIEAYNELVDRVPKKIAAIVAPVAVSRLSK